MFVAKPFYIENQGTWDVYYKLYFDNVEGVEDWELLGWTVADTAMLVDGPKEEAADAGEER